MKRRSLLVGSALASVGAILGVGKAVEEVSQPEKAMAFPPEMFQIAQPEHSLEEIQYAAIRQQPWYQDLVRQRVLARLGVVSGYELQDLLDPPAEVKYALPMDRIIRPLVTDPSPEWLEMNANQPNPQPYRLSGPDSRRAGL